MKDEIELCGGKYKFYTDERGVLLCLRHGEPWRDFVGDNAVLALYRECLDLKRREEDQQSYGDDLNLQ